MKSTSIFLPKLTIKTVALFFLCALSAHAQRVEMRVFIENAAGVEIKPVEYNGELRVPLMSESTPPYYLAVTARDTRGNPQGVNEVTINVAEVWDAFAELFGDTLSLPPVRIVGPLHVVQQIGPNFRPVSPPPIWEMNGLLTFTEDFLLTLTRPRSGRGEEKRVFSLGFRPNLFLVGRGPQPEEGIARGGATSATLFSPTVGGQSIPATDIDWVQPQTSGDADTVLTVTGVGGDADLDGDVDFHDFLTLSGNFGESDKTWRHGDFDGDGVVTFTDYLILSGNYDRF